MPVQSLPQKPKVVPHLDSLGTCPKCGSESIDDSLVVFQDAMERINVLKCFNCGLHGHVKTAITFTEDNPYPDAPEPYALDDDSAPSVKSQLIAQLAIVERLSEQFEVAGRKLTKLKAMRLCQIQEAS